MMTATQKPRTPAKMAASGRALWARVVEKYDLRSDELRVLEDACREADLIDQLGAALSAGDLMVSGSMGQPVVNPLVTEIRQHRATLSTLLGRLKLPDNDSSDAGGELSAKNRAAANARWSSRGA